MESKTIYRTIYRNIVIFRNSNGSLQDPTIFNSLLLWNKKKIKTCSLSLLLLHEFCSRIRNNGMWWKQEEQNLCRIFRNSLEYRTVVSLSHRNTRIYFYIWGESNIKLGEILPAWETNRRKIRAYRGKREKFSRQRRKIPVLIYFNLPKSL